jgi:predicted aspartyl protease
VFRISLAFLSILLVSPGLVAAAGDGKTVSAPEPDPAAVIAALPFLRPEAQDRIYVDLAPEGSRSLVLMLDTGASTSVMTPLAARALGVSVRRTKSSPYRRATRLGRDLQFWVDDLSSDTGSRTGWEYGLLGGDFLEHYVVELDFQERQVRFLDPKRYRVPERVTGPDEAVIPMRVIARRPFTTIEANGKRSQVVIDTGFPSLLVLSGKEARKVGLDPDSLPYYGEIGTVLGDTPGHIGEVDSFQFAGFEFGRVPVVVMPRGFFNMAGSSDSVIGYDVLQQFKLRFDYPRGRLWLKRQGDTRVTFHGADYETMRESGVYLGRAPGSGWWVLSVMPDSPAEQLGLEPGDVIVSWGGELFTPDLEETIQRIEAGAQIVVARQQKGGTWLDVTLGQPDATSTPREAPPGATAPTAEASNPPEAAEETGAVATEAPAPPPARTAEEERAAWQERMEERLFVFENGGWAVVADWRRRLGPKEGEVWVTYDEMREMKRAGQVPEGSDR